MNLSERRVVTLSLMGASSFALMACQPEEKADAEVHRDVAACIAGGGERTACEADYALAITTHQETAPSYDELAVCEEEHGVGQCEEGAHAGSPTGSAFMPIFIGYMVGSMMARNAVVPTKLAPKPLYGVAAGGYASADGAVRTNGLSGTAKIGASAFAKPPSTMTMAPMTKAMVAARGGFSTGRGVSTSG